MASLGNTKIFGNLKVNGELKSLATKDPTRIAFDVASSVSKAAANQQTFDKIYLNNGNCFSTATSRFTAPKTGTYIFYYTSIKSAANTTVCRYHLRKNGVILYGNRQLRLEELSDYGDNGVITWIVQLVQNDYIDVWISAGETYPAFNYNYFNGFLIG